MLPVRRLSPPPLRLCLIAGCLALGACSALRQDVATLRAGASATIARSMLEAVPCVTETLRTTFGSMPERRGSYQQGNILSQEAVRMILVVDLDAAGDKAQATKPEGTPARSLTYEFYNTKGGATLVRYSTTLTGALGAEWLEQAFGPLEQCGATRNAR